MNIRLWYMEQALAEGWSRNVLQAMIKGRAHERQGKAVSNFDLLLPPPQSDMAKQTLKDPYIFDFLTLDNTFRAYLQHWSPDWRKREEVCRVFCEQPMALPRWIFGK